MHVASYKERRFSSLHFVRYFATEKLRLCTGARLILANFELELRECTLRTTTVLKSCDLATGAERTNAPRVLFLYFKLATLHPEQRELASRLLLY